MKLITLQKWGVIVLAVLVPMVLLYACGGGSSSGPSEGGSNTLFYAVKATTPTFAAASSGKPQNAKGKIYSAMSYSDPAMMVVYQLLRNYTYPTDEGVVDMSNIYKILWEAGGKLDNAKSICTAMTSTTDSFISPYAFSDFLGHSYTCGGNISEALQAGYGGSIAYEETGTIRKMLTTYKWAPDPLSQITIGAIQASFDDATNNVELIFAQAVQYPPSSGFATRARITGNSVTHQFKLKMLSGSTSLVGSGLSQGAGNYFLIKSGSNYYCIPATATEADLAIMMPTGVTANCAAYQNDVDTVLTPYSGADLPLLDHSDFNNGVSGTPVFYMMF